MQLYFYWNLRNYVNDWREMVDFFFMGGGGIGTAIGGRVILTSNMDPKE